LILQGFAAFNRMISAAGFLPDSADGSGIGKFSETLLFESTGKQKKIVSKTGHFFEGCF